MQIELAHALWARLTCTVWLNQAGYEFRSIENSMIVLIINIIILYWFVKKLTNYKTNQEINIIFDPEISN